MVKDIFKTDKKFWTQTHCDEVEVFFQFNSFFSKFYQHKDFDAIISMTYYTKINKNTDLFLDNSKRPAAIILLSGQVEIYRKSYQEKPKKIKLKQIGSQQFKQNQPKESFDLHSRLMHQNDSALIDSQCRVTPLNDSEAQILFVPSILYNQHIKILQQQKIDIIYKGLRKFFPNSERKVLVNLAREGCYYKEFRINDFIYRAGNLPEEVYLLEEGNIKMQKPGFSAKKMFQMTIINPPSMFGDKDIKLNHREHSAMSCSAYARTLIIPKKQFLRFAKQSLPSITFISEEESNFVLPVVKSKRSSFDEVQKKQKLKRFHSSNKIENQTFIETKLIKNSHILIKLSPKGSKTSRLEGNRQMMKDYTKDQFKQKINLFNRIRPDAKMIDFSNPMIDLPSKRNKSFRTARLNIMNFED